MKILFAVSHFGFLRNFEFALRELASRGHRVHLLVDRQDELGGQRMVDALASAYPSITWSRGPSAKAWVWRDLAVALRLSLDYWRYLEPRYTGAPMLRARAQGQAPALASHIVSWPPFSSRAGRRALAWACRAMERAVPVSPDVEAFVRDHAPDVLLVTPLLYFGSQQVDYVRAARHLSIPTVLAVGSWDHLTTKGLIHEIPDRVIVWNEAQRREAADIHGVPPEKVVITGAQAYDHWFRTTASRTRATFCAEAGLDPDVPFLLYLCSSPFITPHEVGFVEQWLDAIRCGPEPLASTGVLIRPHPQNADQWRDVDLSRVGNVSIWPRAGANPVDQEARADYFDSMFHSRAVVGVNTSALIESGIVGRPVFTVLTDEFSGTQEGTLHFQHLKSINGGLLHVAKNLEQHRTQLVEALRGQEDAAEKGHRFVDAFIRPLGRDVPAAQVFATAVEDIARDVQASECPGPRSAMWLRPLLYPLATAIRAMRARQRERVRASRAGNRPLRILFVMASAEYLRYYDSTIRLLAERGHRVVVAVNHHRKKKLASLAGFEGVTGVQVAGLVPPRGDVWGNLVKGLRGLMDFIRYLHPRFASAHALRARMKRKALPVAFRLLDVVPRLGAPTVRRIVGGLGLCEAAIPSSRAIERFLATHDPDAVLVSPLIDAASDQVDVIKSAQALGLRTGACIASWDNLTNKGLLRVEPDRVFVWNAAQRHEAMEFHYAPGERIVVTGAQLFDRWFDRRPNLERNAFCAMVGLSSTRPFVLFVGSSGFISEGAAEVAFVRSWIRALRNCEDASVRELGILVRPHPYNAVAWEETDLSEDADVAIWPRGRYDAVSEASRAAFFDSLHHSAVVVGVNTSAMIEAAIVGRPVLSLMTTEFAATQGGTIHFHHLLPENGGCVRVAVGLDEHVGQLRQVIHDETLTRNETRAFVSSFIRPHGLDRPCTPILADAIETLGRLPRPTPRRSSSWLLPVRGGLLFVGALAGAVSAVTSPKFIPRLRKRGRKAVGGAVKRVRRVVRAQSKRVTSPLRRWVGQGK